MCAESNDSFTSRIAAPEALGLKLMSESGEMHDYTLRASNRGQFLLNHKQDYCPSPSQKKWGSRVLVPKGAQNQYSNSFWSAQPVIVYFPKLALVF